MGKKRFTRKEIETLFDGVIDDFIIPLANMSIDPSNQCNIVELSRKAESWMNEMTEPYNTKGV